MIVIGIDPGTARTGYGFVEERPDGTIQAVAYGVIETNANQPMEFRLLELYRQLKTLILLHQPDCGAVEKLFFQKNVSTALSVGQARGVAILALTEAAVPLSEYSPSDVKIAVSGYGGADKNQVQQMVRTLLFLSSVPKPDDAADALAIAICHVQNKHLNDLLMQSS